MIQGQSSRLAHTSLPIWHLSAYAFVIQVVKIRQDRARQQSEE